MTSSYLCAAMLVWATLLAGCTNYVNIPPQPGDLAQHDPNDDAVRIVLVEALRAIVKKYPLENQFAIILSEETTAQTYDAVVPKVSKNAVWPGSKSRSELPVIEVKQLLIRGQVARVDVVRPVDWNKANKKDRLVTVDLYWHPLQGWLTKRVRDWRLPVQDAFRVSVDEAE